MEKAHIMVVDDEIGIRNSLSTILKDEGYTVSLAKDGYEVLDILDNKENPDLILLDIWMPKMDGISALQKIKEDYPNIAVVMISGHGTIETAVKATKLGAYDFIEKPLSIDSTLDTIQNALKNKKESTKTLSSNFEQDFVIIGKNIKILELLQQIEIAAPTNSWVLITGESGTGKELVAKHIFKMSKRSNKPFIDVNCAAIPDELIESELFGHVKGAFTGAIKDKAGKFELADGGTIFLDEVGDMSLKTQAKVLRVLEEKKCQRIGSSDDFQFDVRVISASNKDLAAQIRIGEFREDLFYRLNVIPIHVPPLRERTDDIPLLVDYFLDNLSKDNQIEKKKISKEVIKKLQNYHWPGNIRELKNILERLAIMVQSDKITHSDIIFPIQNIQKNEEDIPEQIVQLKNAREDFEKTYILTMLDKNSWNIPKTAKVMNIAKSNLYKKIKQYEIDIPGD